MKFIEAKTLQVLSFSHLATKKKLNQKPWLQNFSSKKRDFKQPWFLAESFSLQQEIT